MSRGPRAPEPSCRIRSRPRSSGLRSSSALGVARQSEDVLSRASRINALLDQWRLAVAGGASPTAIDLVSLPGENPFWAITGAAGRLGVAYTTAKRAVERLVDASILTPLTDAKRDRVYCARAILEILEDPAQLTPGAETRT